MRLTAQMVSDCVKDCLFNDDEVEDGQPKIKEDLVEVKGVVTHFGFNKHRVEANAEKISYMLSRLPDDFHSTKGGGQSFLNACTDRDGNQWGEHRNIDELF